MTSTSQQARLRDAAQGCGDFQRATFPALIGTLQEVRELSGLWNAGADSGRTSLPRECWWVVRQAKALSSRKPLTIASYTSPLTGSFWVPVRRFGTKPVASAAWLDARSPKVVDNPLLLSGLAFAGANRRASAGVDEDDGILTAEEVAALELEGVNGRCCPPAIPV